MILSAGSKTFLVGEYSVLFGGSAVVLLTSPSFELQAIGKQAELIGVGKLSPAGKFYAKHRDIFENLSLTFIDVHHESGGFGASSAQFVLLYKLMLHITGAAFDIKNFLEEYRALAGNGEVLPSGADCVCQFLNHHIYFDNKTCTVEQIEFDLPNIAFAIFKTNFKVATHEHLRTLRPDFDISELQGCTQNVANGLKTKNEKLVISGVNDFFQRLCEMNLVLPQTKETVSQLKKDSVILAAKGCGALGADTIIVLYEKRNKEHVISIANNLGLKTVVS